MTSHGEQEKSFPTALAQMCITFETLRHVEKILARERGSVEVGQGNLRASRGHFFSPCSKYNKKGKENNGNDKKYKLVNHQKNLMRIKCL